MFPKAITKEPATVKLVDILKNKHFIRLRQGRDRREPPWKTKNPLKIEDFNKELVTTMFMWIRQRSSNQTRFQLIILQRQRGLIKILMLLKASSAKQYSTKNKPKSKNSGKKDCKEMMFCLKGLMLKRNRILIGLLSKKKTSHVEKRTLEVPHSTLFLWIMIIILKATN